ncbi:MAG: nicotinamide-nucleotide amidohydrolase family protein [Chlamydiota bacterium]
MQIEIISIGNELLWGYTVNTNASYLSHELTQAGYQVARHTVIADDPHSIEKGLKEALKRASLVIATGGLGPTLDDLTRKSADLAIQEEPENLKNEIGTALGAYYCSSDKALFLLPGVPREMEKMFQNEAFARIRKQFPQKQTHFITRCSLCLLKEVEVDPFLRALKQKHPDLEIGLFPALGTLQVVFKSQKPVDEFALQLQHKFPTFFYGEGKIEEVVHRELISRQKKLSLAESCTGGQIAAHLTALPDASLYFLGSLVAYSDAWKERFLQVSRTTLAKQGAVSRQTVVEMTEGLFNETDADYAIAVSGIAGPGGGTSAKPVGTIYIAIGKRGEKMDAGLLRAPQDRASAITLSVNTALGALWRRIVHNTATFS